MNRIDALFEKKSKDILSIYFTAGHPGLNDTVEIIDTLQQTGVDLIEVGMPYSDPLADGPAIQKSGTVALKNGMNLDLMFKQIKEARTKSGIPLILMGYLNQIMQYGPERFLERAAITGIDGLIIPDLPMNIFETSYKHLLDRNHLKISFMITPQTSKERILQADRLSSAFLYMVSRSSITGKTGKIDKSQIEYFEKINYMNLKSPRLIGFGIHDGQSYETACKYANGAIIGSAFIRALELPGNLEKNIRSFIENIR